MARRLARWTRSRGPPLEASLGRLRSIERVMKHRPEYFIDRGMVVECEDNGACEVARRDGLHLAEWLVSLSCECILAFCEKATDQVRALTDIHKCPRCMTRDVTVATVNPLPML